MKQGTAKLAEDYCFIHEALRPVGKAWRQIAAVPPSNSRPVNDGTTAIMAVSLRNRGDNGGATAVYAVQAPQRYRASGVTGVLTLPLFPKFKELHF